MFPVLVASMEGKRVGLGSLVYKPYSSVVKKGLALTCLI